MFAQIERWLRWITRIPGGKYCFRCYRPVVERVLYDGDQGSIGYQSTGVLRKAGFHCQDCRIHFCGGCSGQDHVGSKNYRAKPGNLSIECPRCSRWVSSPMIIPPAYGIHVPEKKLNSWAAKTGGPEK